MQQTPSTGSLQVRRTCGPGGVRQYENLYTVQLFPCLFANLNGFLWNPEFSPLSTFLPCLWLAAWQNVERSWACQPAGGVSLECSLLS